MQHSSTAPAGRQPRQTHRLRHRWRHPDDRLRRRTSSVNIRTGPRPRSAPRSSWPPTASPTTTTRSSRPSSSTAPWRSGLVLAGRHRRRPAALLAQRAGPAGRRDRGLRADRSSAGARSSTPTGAQCAGCHGPEGVGGVASYTLTDADGEFVGQVNWQAPALNTVLLRYIARRGALHPQLRPRRSRRCRRGARRAAARSPSSRSTTSSTT